MDYPILDAVPDADRRAVLGAARRRRFARNEVIFHEGDPGDSLHLLAKGHVAIRVTTPLGDTATVRILRPGDFFGKLRSRQLLGEWALVQALVRETSRGS